MAATKTQLTGGGFQDSEGDPLSFGYLKMKLSQDASVSGVGNICSGIEITIQLDVNGNVVASPAQSVWANTGGVLAPINTFYKVTGYTAAGQRAWGPNNQQVAAGATFNLGSWVPNQVIQWFPTVGATPLAVEVRGAAFSSTTLLNFESSDSSVTITDEGSGLLNFQGNSSILEVNGTPITTQSPVNFENGSGIAITNPSAGNILITNSVPGAAFGSGIGAWFLGPGVTDVALIFGSTNFGQVAVNAANGSITANQVAVYLFELYAAFTISKISSECTDNIGGAHATFGIYSQAGAKLVDGGAFSTLTSPGVQTNIITPVTLTPGVYWFAQAATTGTAAHFFGTNVSAASNTNGMIDALLKNATRVAIAANALNSGILPATLGTLTPFTPSNINGDGIALPVFE